MDNANLNVRQRIPLNQLTRRPEPIANKPNATLPPPMPLRMRDIARPEVSTLAVDINLA
jgi:hypothetical protein